jgi:hypothetical protein
VVDPQTVQTSRSSVELHRHKDGTYYWDLKIYQQEGMTLDNVLADIDRADATLSLQYGPRQPA